MFRLLAFLLQMYIGKNLNFGIQEWALRIYPLKILYLN